MSAPENWKPIAGYCDRYEVSDFGRVRNVLTGRVLRPGRMSGGHLSVALGRKNSRTVHSLVMEAFVGPAPTGHECRHLDGDHTNNSLTNLSWGTRSRNIQDVKWHKIKKNAKLTGADARCVKLLIREGVAHKDICALYSISKVLIYNIRHGLVHRDA